LTGLRRTLELLLNRAFRSRWGIAVVLVVLVVGVVAVGRLFSAGTTRDPQLSTATAGPAISVDPAEQDSVISPAPPPSPTTSPGTAEPEAVAYAFASAWVDHRGVSADKWHSRLLPNATKALSDKLSGVDPRGVPADRVVGRPSLVPVGDGLADAVVTVDTGKLRLRLVAPDGHWLVDGVDWDPS
jgi:hypothetical protein